jgi:hypothetical protein
MSSRESCTYFEDLPDEIVYEIFDFLDVYHMYAPIFDLNIQFKNLLPNSRFPITIILSSMSRLTFAHYYKHVFMLNKHRMSSLGLSNLFNIDVLSPQFSLYQE